MCACVKRQEGRAVLAKLTLARPMSSQVPTLLLQSITLLLGAMDVASPQSSSGNIPRYRKSRAH